MHRLLEMRRLVTCWLTAAGLAGAAVVACDSDDNAAGGQASDAGGPDATSSSQTDGAPPPVDGGPVEAGPTVSEVLGTTGLIRVFPDAVQAEFRVDDTVFHVSNAPECVVHLAALGKGFSNAGTLTIGGAIVGADGGPPEPIEVGADTESNNNYLFPGPLFPSDPLLTLQVALAGFSSVPSMPVQTLHVPGSTLLEITAPVPTTPDAGLPPPGDDDDDGGPPPPPPPPPPADDDDDMAPPGPGPGPGPANRHLVISSAQPFEIHWVVPAGSTAAQRVLVTFRDVAGAVASKAAQLYCDYPVTQGTAVIPANLLGEIRSRVGEGAIGQFTILFGDRKVYSASSPGNVSYVVDVTQHDNTTLHPDGNFIEAELK